MTVGELRKKLAAYNEDDQVTICDGFGYPRVPRLARPEHNRWFDYPRKSTVVLKPEGKPVR